MVITWSDKIRNPSSQMMSWKELMNLGKGHEFETEIHMRHRRMAINECCLLIYTSGTTGNPKGIYIFW